MLSNGKVADGSESSWTVNAEIAFPAATSAGIRLKAARRVNDMLTSHSKAITNNLAVVLIAAGHGAAHPILSVTDEARLQSHVEPPQFDVGLISYLLTRKFR